MHSPRLLLAWSLGVGMSTTDTVAGGARPRVRWVIALLTIGITLDLVVSLALGALAVQAKNAGATAHIARVAAYESCMASNRAKQADSARWDTVVQLIETGPGSPQVETFLAGLEKANAAADKPFDCGVPVH